MKSTLFFLKCIIINQLLILVNSCKQEFTEKNQNNGVIPHSMFIELYRNFDLTNSLN